MRHVEVKAEILKSLEWRTLRASAQGFLWLDTNNQDFRGKENRAASGIMREKFASFQCSVFREDGDGIEP